ncbi:MAG: hypothetical protein ACQER7_03740 [Bacteroidota bacterium]
MSKPISKRDLNRIKKKLKKPYSERIAVKVGKSASLVYAVMNNHRGDHYGIIDAAIEDIKEQKKREKEEKEKYKNELKNIS